MTNLETRYPCPVCLGVKLEKVQLVTTASAGPSGPDLNPQQANSQAGPRTSVLVLDHCARCGGVWFDAGEVRRIRECDATALWSAIARRDGVHSMLCHGCKSPLPRSETKCQACGWTVALDCPICSGPMRIDDHDEFRLDYCPHDKGVWFDHDELTGIWKMKAQAVAKRRHSGAVAADGLSDVLFDPYLLYFGADAAIHVASAAGHAVASGGVVHALGDAAEAVGEVASAIFEAVAEIIGGIFD